MLGTLRLVIKAPIKECRWREIERQRADKDKEKRGNSIVWSEAESGGALQ